MMHKGASSGTLRTESEQEPRHLRKHEARPLDNHYRGPCVLLDLHFGPFIHCIQDHLVAASSLHTEGQNLCNPGSIHGTQTQHGLPGQ